MRDNGNQKIFPLTILEGALAEFGSFLLEFLNGTLIDTTALVDQVTGGGRLARVDVTDDCNGVRSSPITIRLSAHRRRLRESFPFPF